MAPLLCRSWQDHSFAWSYQSSLARQQTRVVLPVTASKLLIARQLKHVPWIQTILATPMLTSMSQCRNMRRDGRTDGIDVGHLLNAAKALEAPFIATREQLLFIDRWPFPAKNPHGVVSMHGTLAAPEYRGSMRDHAHELHSTWF